MKIRLIQLVCALVMIICCIGLGLEIFVRDMENLTMLRIYGYTALVALYVNAAAAIYRVIKMYGGKERRDE